MHQRGDEARAGEADGVSHGDRAAVGVEFVWGNLQLADTWKDLRRERFVEFNYGHIVDGQSRALEHFARRRNGPQPHVGGVHPRHRRRDHARHRREVQTLRGLRRDQQHGRRAVVDAR